LIPTGAAFEADPNRTFALVVGIESYAIGESWNLDGPAADAARFVNWLRARSVPAANIWLHASPLNEQAMRQLLTDAAVAVQSATRESIRRRITDLLSVPGDLLYFFWGGHGSTITSRDRRLYYADARTEDRQNLQIGALLDYLQSDTVKIKRQIAFIDACANIANDPGRLPADQFPSVRAGSQVVQSFFFSAAPGQRAQNDAVLRGGTFSHYLQAALDAAPQAPFPPNPTAIIQDVKGRLDQPGQTGVSYESQDWVGNIRTSPGATEGPYLRYAARKLRLPLGQLEQLFSAFSRCPAIQAQAVRADLASSLSIPLRRQIYRPSEILADAPADLLRQFTAAWFPDRGETFQRAFEQHEPISQESDEVSDLLLRLRRLDEARGLIENLPELPGAIARYGSLEDYLGGTLNQASSELQAFFEAVTRIVEAAPAGPQADAIHGFLDRYCSNPTRQKIRATLDAEAAGLPHFLLVRAIPGKPDRLSALWVREDRRLLRKWDLACPLEERSVEQKLVEILQDIWQTGDFPLSIEIFLLPETLHWTPDAWSRLDEFNIEERFSTRYPLVVHWVKRWSEPGTAAGWTAACERIRQNLEQPVHPCCPFLDRGENDISTIAGELTDGRRGPLLALLLPLSLEPGKAPPRELITAIRAGAPFICWLRESPEDWQAFRREVEALMPAPGQPEHFDQIPHRILHARRTAAADPPAGSRAILGGKLTLLWDDCRRSPFENKYRPPT
jgi:vWA-MoxR associated protein C-terminal domain/Caspase domain